VNLILVRYPELWTYGLLKKSILISRRNAVIEHSFQKPKQKKEIWLRNNRSIGISTNRRFNFLVSYVLRLALVWKARARVLLLSVHPPKMELSRVRERLTISLGKRLITVVGRIRRELTATPCPNRGRYTIKFRWEDREMLIGNRAKLCSNLKSFPWGLQRLAQV
jgi:hypothetical protein